MLVMQTRWDRGVRRRSSVPSVFPKGLACGRSSDCSIGRAPRRTHPGPPRWPTERSGAARSSGGWPASGVERLAWFPHGDEIADGGYSRDELTAMLSLPWTGARSHSPARDHRRCTGIAEQLRHEASRRLEAMMCDRPGWLLALRHLLALADRPSSSSRTRRQRSSAVNGFSMKAASCSRTPRRMTASSV